MNSMSRNDPNMSSRSILIHPFLRQGFVDRHFGTRTDAQPLSQSSRCTRSALTRMLPLEKISTFSFRCMLHKLSHKLCCFCGIRFDEMKTFSQIPDLSRAKKSRTSPQDQIDSCKRTACEDKLGANQ